MVGPIPRAAVLIGMSAGALLSHDVITTKITWSKEISRLVYKRCASCHAPGQSAFSLLEYDEARPWAKAIKEETGARRMPPWQAVKGFGDFEGDRGLTQEEIEMLSDWVEGGAPEGDPKFLPEKPKPASWQDPATPPGSAAIAASAGFRLHSAARVIAVRPDNLTKGISVQAVAKRPDGTVEPLVWIYRYNPKFQRTYYFRAPIELPAGTVIEMSTPGAGSLNLFSKIIAEPRP
jgi:hypothetical protein